MISVTATVIAATAAGVLIDRRTRSGERIARACLNLMLYTLLPFVAYTSFAHLHLSIDAGVGLALAYVGLGLAGVLAYLVGRRWLGLDRPSLGALLCAVLLVNTGYLGFPMTVAIFGASHLSQAVAYDGAVSGPMFFTAGFAIGAVFGSSDAKVSAKRALTTITRNPPLVAVVAGLLVPNALAPQALVEASHVVVDALLVIGFVAVGISLSVERREDQVPLLERPDRRVGVALALRFSTTASLLLLGSAAGFAIPSVYILQAAMPSGISALIVGHTFELDQGLIATVIVWSTITVLLVGLVGSLL